MAKGPQIDSSTDYLYEDFQPSFQWKEEPENSIVVVYLPDFKKEQIHITCLRSSRIVQVTGERKLANNKWSRLNRTFQIPPNCKIDKIHAKWQNGNLTVTMPKETITQPVVRKEEAKTTQEAPKAASEPKSPRDRQQAGASAKAADNEAKSLKDYQQVASPKAEDKEAKYSKDQAAPGKAAASSIIEKQNEAKKDASLKATSSIHGEKNTDGKSIDALSAQKSEKEAKLKKGDHQDEAASTMRKKERREPVEKKQKEKNSVPTAAMNAMNEDKQLMINIGVAALVLVALGAYVSYRFVSKSKE